MSPAPVGRWLTRLKPDVYILLILGMVVLATILPAAGEARPVLKVAVSLGIGLVFFLHGARLSRDAVIAGATQWRLHAMVLAATFLLFPALCLMAEGLPAWILPASLAPGLLFLGCLPSTIQSSIGFTSIARGNVAATVAAATASNLLGIFVTPVLAGLLLLHGLREPQRSVRTSLPGAFRTMRQLLAAQGTSFFASMTLQKLRNNPRRPKPRDDA